MSKRAEASLAKALGLAPAGHPERAHRCSSAGRRRHSSKTGFRKLRAALEEALDLYRRQDASIAAGRVLTALSGSAGSD